MPITLERKLPIILFFAFLMMATAGYVSYRNTSDLKEAIRQEKHTQEVLIKLDETLMSVVDIETGMRGFFISADEKYLDPYNGGRERLGPNIDKLRELVSDNPAQLERIAVLRTLIDERVTDAERKVAARRGNTLDGTIALFKTPSGRVTMDKIRAEVDEIKVEEMRLLAGREKDLEGNLSRAVWILIGTSVAGLLSLGLANLVVFFEIRKRKTAEDALIEANRELEGRVAARTSELAKVNENLAESELFSRAVIDSLPAHIAVLDRDGNILLVNEAWERFAETNSGDPGQIAATGVGQNYLAVLDGDPADEGLTAISRDLKALLAGEKDTFALEYPCHSADEERWFLMQANALQSPAGGVVISHFNITSRVKAEQAVRLSEEFNRSIVENSPDCVKVLELGGAMLSMNYPGMCLMEIDDFGPFVGRQWIDNWEGDGGNLAREAVKKAQNGEAVSFEGFCRTAKGNPKWWEVSVAPVMNELGKPHRILVVSREISERKKAEEEREGILRSEKEARREAEIANRLRDEFMATVSHELRTPLNSILGWARLLKGGMLDEAVSAKAIDTIIKSSETQNRLIADLLDVARMISGKLELDITEVSIAELISNCIEAVGPSAAAKDVSLILDIGEDLSETTIPGDVDRIRQIILNLLTNAIKFSHPGGKVDIGVSNGKEMLEIRIADEGVGISPEFLPFVFERFRQDTSNIEKRSGLGLGLAIVRNLVELHNGTVRAESQGENKGAVFTLNFPLAN